jgi:hypothetical protein
MTDEQNVVEREDGFRSRRKRPKGWLSQAIKDGSVRDPNASPEPAPVYGADVHVIDVPLATSGVDGEEG